MDPGLFDIEKSHLSRAETLLDALNRPQNQHTIGCCCRLGSF